MHKDNFDKGIDIGITENPLGFIYGKDVFGPTVENRWLDDIRSSLLDPKCEGPDIVYSIAMDVGKTVHKALLQKQHLLFGVVAYAKEVWEWNPFAVRDIFIRSHLLVNGPLQRFMRYGMERRSFTCKSRLQMNRGGVMLFMHSLAMWWWSLHIGYMLPLVRMQMNLLCLVHGVTVNMVLNMLRFVVIKVLHGILFLRVMD